MATLARFELSPDQVTRISEPGKRHTSGVDATEDEIIENPYLISHLTDMGQDVCATEHGKHLGKGLFEFRVRHDESVIRGKAGQSSAGRPTAVLLRMFCHAYGERIVLLLGGYDKGAAPSKKRQDAEIETARRRLRSFQTRVQRERAERRRG